MGGRPAASPRPRVSVAGASSRTLRALRPTVTSAGLASATARACRACPPCWYLFGGHTRHRDGFCRTAAWVGHLLRVPPSPFFARLQPIPSTPLFLLPFFLLAPSPSQTCFLPDGRPRRSRCPSTGWRPSPWAGTAPPRFALPPPTPLLPLPHLAATGRGGGCRRAAAGHCISPPPPFTSSAAGVEPAPSPPPSPSVPVAAAAGVSERAEEG